jgi:peptidoglycan/LPS O-acetylase OafA/YrhL
MIKSLEGARGLAAVLVALFHFQVAAKYFSPIEYGYLFVDLFFVLSGFVICAAYSSRLNSLGDLKPFMIRRLGRLFPLMIISTILFVLSNDIAVLAKRIVVGMGYTGMFKNPDALAYMIPNAKEVIGTLLLVQGMGLFDSTILNYASWSISVEFYTYILFAATCILLRGKARILAWTVLSIAGILVTIWASFVAHSCLRGNACYNVSYDFGYARCVGAFFLGALVFRLSRAISFNMRTLQLIVAIALIFFFLFVGNNLQITMCFPILCALIVLSISRDTGPVSTGLQHKWFQVLGQRSFSIYMLHPVLLAFLIPTATVIDRLASPIMTIGLSVIAMVFYIAILVAVSGWTYSRIEAPAREWFNRYAAKKEVDRVVVSQG